MPYAQSHTVEAVHRLVERLDADDIAGWEFLNELVALLDHETIDAVVEALPEEHRAALLEHFDALAPEDPTDVEMVTIRPGTFFTRERQPWMFSDAEWDRIEREERERDARERAHFRNVTLPAIREWRARRRR